MKRTLMVSVNWVLMHSLISRNKHFFETPSKKVHVSGTILFSQIAEMKRRIALETKITCLLKKNFIVTDFSTLNSVTMIKTLYSKQPRRGRAYLACTSRS